VEHQEKDIFIRDLFPPVFSGLDRFFRSDTLTTPAEANVRLHPLPSLSTVCVRGILPIFFAPFCVHVQSLDNLISCPAPSTPNNTPLPPLSLLPPHYQEASQKEPPLPPPEWPAFRPLFFLSLASPGVREISRDGKIRRPIPIHRASEFFALIQKTLLFSPSSHKRWSRRCNQVFFSLVLYICQAKCDSTHTLRLFADFERAPGC